MLTFCVYLTCYMANASFTYNPLARTGVLSATFMQDDGSDAVVICRGLNGHLARASVQFFVAYTMNGSEISDVRYSALSENFYFKFAADLNLVLTASEEAHVYALITTQANFYVEILDMDSMISQTLSAYSVQSYNLDECYSDLQMLVYEDQLRVAATARACDLKGSLFQQLQGRGESVDNTAIAKISVAGVGTMQSNAGKAAYSALSSTSKQFSLTFNCVYMALENEANGKYCSKIVEYLIYHTDYSCTFSVSYRMLSRNLSYNMENSNTAIYTEALNGCLTASYALNEKTIVVHFVINSEPRCQTAADYKSYYQGNLWNTLTGDRAGGFYFNETVTFVEGYSKVAIQCDRQANPAECTQKLRALTLLDQLTMRFRLYRTFADGTVQFYSFAATREDHCFLSISSYVFVESYKTNSGGVRVELEWTNSQLCRRYLEIRTSLGLKVMMRKEKNGRLDQTEAEPVLEFEQREIFSNKNTTVTFTCDNCKEQLYKVGQMITDKKDYCIFAVGDQLIAVNYNYNEIYDTNPNIFMGIGIALGCLLGIAGFFLDYRGIMRARKMRYKPIAVAADEL